MKAFSYISSGLFAVLAVVLLAGCKHEPGVAPAATTDDGYPEHISALLVTRCATAGCHNDASAVNSKGLNLTSWEKLFAGAASGSVIIPFHLENSSLLHFINRDSSLGPVFSPAMPYNNQDPDVPVNPLTRDEYLAVRDWIMAGAPNKKGEVPFGSKAETRQKIYCTMQGCDLLGVLDAETRLVMRYIPIGKKASIESPHCVRVSPDGRYAYVSFILSDWVQKINTQTDQVEDEINLGPVGAPLTQGGPPSTQGGAYNVLHLSQDGERFVVTNWKGSGDVIVVKTADMTVERHFGGDGVFKFPHGVAALPSFDTFYVTAEAGNVVYKISRLGYYYKKIRIDNGPETFDALTRDPHEIIFSPDYSKYFLSCQYSNEVRVMDAHTDALLAVIPVGTRPREMDISRKYPYLFVTCEEDAATAPIKGSVYCIDYNTYQVVRRMEDGRFSQPHGIAVDDRNDLLYIASKNTDPNGPRQHHASSCTGRNGWYSVYSLSTLQPADGKRYEVSVEPYSMDARFKGPN